MLNCKEKITDPSASQFSTSLNSEHLNGVGIRYHFHFIPITEASPVITLHTAHEFDFMLKAPLLITITPFPPTKQKGKKFWQNKQKCRHFFFKRNNLINAVILSKVMTHFLFSNCNVDIIGFYFQTKRNYYINCTFSNHDMA